MLRSQRRRRQGQSMIEIAVIIALVAAVTILGLSVAGVRIDQLLCRVVGAFGVSCGALFADDFDDLSAWKAVSGNWKSVNGQLCGGPSEGKIFAPITGDNYTIEIDTARLTQGDGYGVFFRAQEVNTVNGYTFQYDPGLSGFVFRKWVKGREVWAPLALASKPGYDWYSGDRTIQLTVNGDTFTAHVDGQTILSVTDATYAEGGIGLRTWDNTKVCFDDLTVHSVR